MRKDRVLEYRVGEIRVKGDVGQALHSENVFFFLCKRQKLYTKKDLTPILPILPHTSVDTLKHPLRHSREGGNPW